ncbi:MAG: dihydrofolate reductase family protein [Chitinophagaceae bacterium]|nr:dihydrofolate reductase family protein [Chitinophagaceae bacterium]
MRKLIYGINISLDGCCDHTRFGGAADVHDYFTALMERTDTVIYGRKTYELMVPFWPEVARTASMDAKGNAFAKVFAGLKRVVVSRTVEDAADEQSRIIRDQVQEEIMKLKQQPGKAISTGGVSLPAQLIEWGLVDEFHMVVHPVLVGQGRRLFTEMQLPENLGLQLRNTQVMDSGCVALCYEKK